MVKIIEKPEVEETLEDLPTTFNEDTLEELVEEGEVENVYEEN